MSTTIDQRVVEMRFDNKNFERNVSTTMSTLDKLKQKLNLPGAAKSLDAVGNAAKRVDMSGLSNSVETVRSRFSALEVMGITALSNLTNSAVNAGKRIVSALTIDPVKTGFSEYELKMGSIQTIMASTGADLATVNKYLEELNKYSDQTIYSFSDMTTNIGKFTNAGVKLPDAVAAIKGVSNVAAVSGANANEASRAMYNFAQALSAGYVKLMDWKSIENANMATVEFKEQLIASAVAAGTLKKTSDGMYKTLEGTVISSTKNFNESLQEQWMTTDVLITTLSKYADETTDIGKKAKSAAQDVKTFSQLFDTLKESAQSGWAKTWELIVGDFEESKKFLTGLSKSIGGFIESISDARNNMIEAALGDNGGPLTGREMLLEGFQNILEAILKPLQAIGKAWKEVFPTKDTGNTLYNMIEGFHKFTQYLVMNEDALDNLTRTFKGIFSVLDLVLTLVGGPLSVAFKVFFKILDIAGIDILEFTASIGDALVEFREWLDGLKDAKNIPKNIIDGLVKGIKSGIKNVTDAIKNLGQMMLDTLKDLFGIHSPATAFIAIGAMCIAGLVVGLQNGDSELIKAVKESGTKIIEGFVDILTNILNYIKDLPKNMSKIGNSIKSGASSAGKALSSFGTKIKNSFKKNDISEETDKIQEAISSVGSDKTLEGFDKITDKVETVFPNYKKAAEEAKKGAEETNGFVEVLKKIGEKLLGMGGEIDFDKIVASIIGIGSVVAMNRASKGIESFGSMFDSFGNVLEDIGKAIANFGKAARDMGKGFKKWMKSMAAENNAKALKELAIAILILAAAVVILATLPTGKLWSAVGAIAALGAVIAVLGLIMSKMNNVVKFGKQGVQVNTAVLSILGVAVSLLMVAAAAYLLITAINKISDFESAIGILIGVFVAVLALLGVMALVARSKANENITKVGVMLTKLAVALGLLILVTKLAGILNIMDIVKAGLFINAFAAFLLMLTGLSRHSNENIAKVGSMLIKVSFALLVLVAVTKLAGMLSVTDILKGTVVLGIFVGFVAALNAVGRLAKDGISDVGSMMVKIAIAIIALGVAVRVVGGLDSTALTKGLAVVTAFGGIVTGLMAASRLAGDNVNKIGIMILSFAAAMLILSAAIFVIGQMDTGELVKGITIVGLLGAIIAGVIRATAQAKSLQKMLTGFGLAMLMFAAVIVILAFVDPADIAKGLVAIAILTGIVAGLLLVTKHAKHLNKDLLILASAVAILGTVVFILSFMKPEQVATAAAAIALMAGAFAGVMYIAKLASGVKFNWKTLLQIGILLTVLAGIIVGLSFINGDNAMKSAIGLSALLVAMIGSLALLNHAGTMSAKAFASLGLLTAVVATLAGILYVMGAINVKDALPNAIALSILLGTMTVVLMLLTVVGPLITQALKGAVALTAMVVPLIAFAAGMWVIGKMNIQAVIPTVLMIAALMVAFTVLLPILAIVGAFIMPALMGIVALTAMIAPMIALGWGLSLVSEMKIADAEPVVLVLSSLILAMLTVLPILALIGPFAAPALAGILALTAMVAPLITLGWGLSLINDMNIGDALPTVRVIGELLLSLSVVLVVLSVVGTLAVPVALGIAVLLTFAAGLVGFLVVMSSVAAMGFLDGLPKLGQLLTDFMVGAAGFIDVISKLDDTAIKGAKVLVDIIEALADASIQQFVSAINGGPSFKDIGTRLSEFGDAASGFIEKIKQIDEGSVTGAKMLVDSISVLSECTLSDGIFSADYDMEFLKTRLESFAQSLVNFSNTIKGNLDEEAISAAKIAADMFIELNNKLPKANGVVQWFEGESMNFTTFGDQLEEFGKSIVKFSKTVSADGAINKTAISAAASAGDIMVTLANKLPKANGVTQWFEGQNDLQTFGNQMYEFGHAIVKFSNTVSTENGGSALNQSAIEATKVACEIMIALATQLPKMGGIKSWWSGDQDLAKFGEKLVEFGTHIKDFSTEVTGVNANNIKTLAEGFSAIVDLANQASNANFDGLSNLKTACEDLADISVDNVIDAIAAAGDGLKKAGKEMVNSLIDGIDARKERLTNSLKTVITTAASAAKGKYESFKSAGAYLAQGLARGILSKKSEVVSAANEVATAAKDAMTFTFKVASPSKWAYKTGGFVVQGLVNALHDGTDSAYAAGAEVADSTKLGLNNAVSKLRDAINCDMDLQPTISPVLDLNDVRSGVNTIGDMLNFGSSVAVAANVGKVGVMMSGYRQNRGNEDVVSAIDKLNNKMDNLGNTTYSVNGITYDDGSNIANAVKDLVRAAKIERRT